MRALIALVVVCGCAGGGSSVIKGRVIDSNSQSGVDNVMVMARGPGGSSSTDVSNWNGEFDLQVGAGTYDVVFHHRNGTTSYRVLVPDASKVVMEAVIQSSSVRERNYMRALGKHRGDPTFWTRPTPHRPVPPAGPTEEAPGGR
jgi:hypothetical protein